MRFFDSDPCIIRYFQPRVIVPVPANGRQLIFEIDFWIDYSDGMKTDWVHIQREGSVLELPTCTKISVADVIGVVVIRIDKHGVRILKPTAWP